MRLDKAGYLIAAALLFVPVTVYGSPSPGAATPKATACPASPAVKVVPAEGTLVSGQEPIWVANVPPPVKWSDLPKTLSPYPGALWKTLFYIRQEDFGYLQLQATQLDGDGVVLFPLDGAQAVEKNGVVIGSEVRLDLGEPVTTRIIPTEFRRYFAYAVTGGYVQTGALLIFPSPGCYQLTVAVGEHTANIVYEIRP